MLCIMMSIYSCWMFVYCWTKKSSWKLALLLKLNGISCVLAKWLFTQTFYILQWKNIMIRGTSRFSSCTKACTNSESVGYTLQRRHKYSNAQLNICRLSSDMNELANFWIKVKTKNIYHVINYTIKKCSLAKCGKIKYLHQSVYMLLLSIKCIFMKHA